MEDDRDEKVREVQSHVQDGPGKTIGLRLRQLRAKAYYERRKVAARIRYREKWNNDPEFRKKEQQRRKKYADRNPELESARSKRRYHANKELRTKQKQEWAERRREHVNEYRRNHYRKNADRMRAKSAAAKRRSDPTVGLKSSIHACKRGDIDVVELTRRFDEALVRLHAKTNRKESAGIRRSSDGGHRQSEDNNQLRIGDREPDESKT